MVENPSLVPREEKIDRGKRKKNMIVVREKDRGKRKINRGRITDENCRSFLKKEEYKRKKRTSSENLK